VVHRSVAGSGCRRAHHACTASHVRRRSDRGRQSCPQGAAPRGLSDCHAREACPREGGERASSNHVIGGFDMLHPEHGGYWIVRFPPSRGHASRTKTALSLLLYGPNPTTEAPPMTASPPLVPPAAVAVIGLGNMGVPMGACLIK